MRNFSWTLLISLVICRRLCKIFAQLLYSRKYLHNIEKKLVGEKRKLIKNMSELIKTLECDELEFLEVIEPKYEREIEINMSKKHCVL